MRDPQDPLDPTAAKQLFRRILAEGTVRFSGHAKKEMKDDGLAANDCFNVLRGGVVDPPELHGATNAWRYQVHTQAICVVVQPSTENELLVVTAWRKKD